MENIEKEKMQENITLNDLKKHIDTRLDHVLKVLDRVLEALGIPYNIRTIIIKEECPRCGSKDNVHNCISLSLGEQNAPSKEYKETRKRKKNI